MDPAGSSATSAPVAADPLPTSEPSGGTASTDDGGERGDADLGPTDSGSPDSGSPEGESSDGESSDAESTGPDAPEPGTTEPSPDTETEDGSGAGTAGEPGTAVVEVDGERYEFVVIQCVRDQPSPLTGDIVEFQLDGVPLATPPDLVERLLGVIEADADVLAEIEPVVEFGPILSVTRVAAGGDQVAVTDLATIEAVSDPDPTSTRFAEIGAQARGAAVSATTTADGRPMTVQAVCP